MTLRDKLRLCWAILRYTPSNLYHYALRELPTADYDEADLTYFALSYEAQADRYWAAIKARMKADNRPRPSEWY